MDILGITCLRDEGPWLLDWIAHHRALGFTHFLIASHDLSDGSDALLDALDAAGVVTHVPFQPKGGKSVQWQAMKLLSDLAAYKEADLALFFDVDEYLVLDEGTLAELVPDSADAVALRWHLFGHAGLSCWQDTPVTERFTHAAPDDIALPLAHFFKSLHRPTAFDGLGVHRPKGRDGRWIAANGTPMPPAFCAAQARINLFGLPHQGERAWLNHYSVRSIEEFVLKTQRGLPNHMEKPVGLGYWAERNFNTCPDTRIARHADAARAARQDLRAFDPLHMACLQHHRVRLDALMQEKPVVDLMWQLTLLAGSTPPDAPALKGHLARLTALAKDA